MPYHHFTSPLEKWAVQPSFVVGEYLFIAAALIALYHAIVSGRAHVLVWIGALIAGTANDLIFMALPLVDNFWQAQATIMLSARMPLYIPCVYVCFMYFPTVTTLRLGWAPLPTALLSGLLASLFYAPYDIVGAKFLWWTWHDTDRPIDNRILGAPVGSTMWVITFVAVFSYLLNRVIRRDPAVRPASFALGLGLVAGLTTILMVLQMTALQQLDDGVPGPRGLAFVIALYGGIIVWRARRPSGSPRSPTLADRVLTGMVIVHFVALALIVAVFQPETHVSASVHQTYGPCHVEAKDITGSVRYEFLCKEDYDEDFTFQCAEATPEPEPNTRWYTVCGRKHTNYPLWLGVVAALGIAGIAAFAAAGSASRSR